MHFLDPGAVSTSWLRRVTRRRRCSVSATGSQVSGRKTAARSEARTPASILSVLTRGWAIALTCVGLATITRAHKGSGRELLPSRSQSLDYNFVILTQASRSLPSRNASCRSGPLNEAAVFPEHRFRKSAVKYPCQLPVASLLLLLQRREQWRHLRIRACQCNRGGGQLTTRALSSSCRSACPPCVLPVPSSPDQTGPNQTKQTSRAYHAS
jgi:hypothetical protein